MASVTLFCAYYHSVLCRLNGVFLVVLSIFESLQVKETALLVGACGSVSGLVMRETRLCFVGSVKLGVRCVFRGGRIFFVFYCLTF